MDIITKLIVVITCFAILKYYNVIDLDIKNVLFICIMYIILFNKTKLIEGLDNTSNEAVQSVASMYNSGNLTATNLNISGTTTLASLNLLPKGVIVAWNSEVAPAGWALCDGTNGTPDLRGRFIRMQNDQVAGTKVWDDYVYSFPTQISTTVDKTICGAARTAPVSYILKFKFGDYAGTDHHTLTNNEIPAHSHNMMVKGACFKNGGCDDRFALIANGGGDEDPKAKAIRTIAGISDISTFNNANGGSGHNNMPPFYVLSYIMKL